MANKHTLTIRVRYADIDKMGVAYNSRYFEWFEMGRTEFFRALGKTYKELEQAGIFLPVYEAYCKYIKPVYYDELIDLVTEVREFSKAKIVFDYSVFSESGELVAQGYTVHPFVNAAFKPLKLSSEQLHFFQPLIGGVQ